MVNCTTRPIAVVVNDDPTQLVILAKLLVKAGIEASAFESAQAALAAMDPAAPPDLIVTDLYMPGIDGWKLCRLLRSPEYAAFNEVPILVVSATFAGDHPKRIAADAGADIFLPSPVDGEQFVAQARALIEGKQERRQPSVLIVEDDEAHARLLQRVFRANGYRTSKVFTARKAEDAFAKTAYDVAVLDHRLPDGAGDALLEAFRTQRPDCVCLMMTTDPTPELALDWMKRGAAAYLHKPFEPDFLIELCARARRERALLRAEDLLEARTRELRESEEKYRSLFDQSASAIYLHDLDGQILDANEAACAQLGYSRDEFLRLTVFDLHPALENTPNLPRDEILRHWTQWQPGERHTFQAEHLRKGGTTIPVELSTGPVGVAGQTLILAIANDITERKRLQEQLTQAQKMESVGRLAGGVAHDFNNMLSVIMGHAALALEGLGANDPLHGDLEEIQKAAERSADLTRQLLAFARKQVAAPKVLDLNKTVAGMLKILRRLIGEDIDLAWKPGRGLWPVKVDPSQIDQVLANLCVNARDAIADVGQVIIETGNLTLDEAWCARNPGVTPGEYVLLAVSDSGCGMDAETLSHLFEPFFTTKEMGRGTGLGLATVHGIVKQNNGFVNVYSEPGQGTAVKLHLPRHAAEAGCDTHESRPRKVARGSETILVVEDEPVVLRLAAQMLGQLGYTALTAATPAEALRQAGEHSGRIHLLMTDVVMPEMNGSELAREVEGIKPGVRTLFMSGYTADLIAHHGVLDEGVHFLQKPFTRSDLAQKVREAVEGR